MIWNRLSKLALVEGGASAVMSTLALVAHGGSLARWTLGAGLALVAIGLSWLWLPHGRGRHRRPAG